ncbi:DNA-damage-repair/toleration protein DRT102 [Pyrus ussuriensis x Pyrus communis]|uniref:DNA-damage-repair/toleration protein DRT102 n=1 Tax=Pyrus ussuriensis x Pyrus communis TaxID=2448454 RepID=A0A5N5GUE9_9ROSA|nr:DNA-damage-repair/toleration protein DRT102 [Pyrus ussuriensis x Pyrus communis]
MRVLSQVSRISTVESSRTLKLLMERELWASDGVRQVAVCERVTGRRDVAAGGEEKVMGFV